MTTTPTTCDEQQSRPPLLIALRDAGHALAISERTIRQLALDGRIVTVRIGRRVLVPRAELERIAREGVSR